MIAIWSGVRRRVCDNDRDLNGKPEEARPACSLPDWGGEGRLLQGHHHCGHHVYGDDEGDVVGEGDGDGVGQDDGNIRNAWFKISEFVLMSISDLLQAMDENGDGAISYDEWLGFFLKV